MTKHSVCLLEVQALLCCTESASRVPWARLCWPNCPLQVCTQLPVLVKGKGHTTSKSGTFFSHQTCARAQQYEIPGNKRLVYTHLRTWNLAQNASLASWESWKEIVFHCSKQLNSKNLLKDKSSKRQVAFKHLNKGGWGAGSVHNLLLKVLLTHFYSTSSCSSCLLPSLTPLYPRSIC